MKILNQAAKCIGVLSLLTIIASSVHAGEKGGNGGDAVASEFSRLAGNAMTALTQVCRLDSKQPSCQNLSSLERGVDRATVKVQNHVFGEDKLERDAINDGDFLITVGKNRWKDLRPMQKLSIAIHEHLSIMKVESSDQYGESNEILSTLIKKGWTVDELTSGSPGVKTFTNHEVVLISGSVVYYVAAHKNSEFGFCISKGFSTVYTFQFSNLYASTQAYALISINASGLPGDVVDPKSLYLSSVTCKM